jgi:NADPH2:quinone reductase
MPRQVIVQSSIEAVEIIDTPIPLPRDKEIIIKVIVSGTNPKDWKIPTWYTFPSSSICIHNIDTKDRKNFPHNSGDDIAGIVHSVGKDVYEFQPGDRVAALHAFQQGDGSFAEYAVAPDWTTFHIPHSISFEEAATIPLAALTAVMALYADMKLPAPWEVSTGERTVPLLIYGVTSAVGAFAAKLARLSGCYPIIGVAGRSSDFARTLADYVVDYRNGEEALVAGVKEILAKENLGSTISNVFDAISEDGSLEATLSFLDLDGGQVSTVLPPALFAKEGENFKYPPGVKAYNSACIWVHLTHKDLGYLWSRYMGRLLQDGRLKGHPYEVIPGGLNGVLTGLQKLRNGEARGVKYVYRIEETDDTAGVKFESADAYGAKPGVSKSRFRDFPFVAKD